jgi:hypothetical protein
MLVGSEPALVSSELAFVSGMSALGVFDSPRLPQNLVDRLRLLAITLDSTNGHFQCKQHA